MPLRPKRLNYFQALRKQVKAQGHFYDSATWEDADQGVTGWRRIQARKNKARAVVIVGSVLTLGAWHLPWILVSAQKKVNKRRRAIREFDQRAEAAAERDRFIRSVESVFIGKAKALAEEYDMEINDVKLCQKYMMFRLGLGMVPAAYRAQDEDFLERYFAMEAEMRENPTVERLFTELGIE